MIISRNKTSHTYNEDTAKELLDLIVNSYTSVMNELFITMSKLADKEI